jgi:hypothetical protein
MRTETGIISRRPSALTVNSVTTTTGREDSPNKQPGTTTSPQPQVQFTGSASADELAAAGFAVRVRVRRIDTEPVIITSPNAQTPSGKSNPLNDKEEDVNEPQAVQAAPETRAVVVDSQNLNDQAAPSIVKERVMTAIRVLIASLPSAMFAGLALGNVQEELYSLICIGQVGMDIEKGLFPLASFLVNLATALEEQLNYARSLSQFLATETTYKERAAFLLTNVIAAIAAVTTIPMARDAAQTMGIASQNPHVNLALKISSVICMSVLYTVVTRQTASLGLFKEIPDFGRWANRKARMVFADQDAYRFSQDVKRFVDDLKTEEQLRQLTLLLASETMDAVAITEFLKSVGYRPYPSVAKIAVTSTLLAAIPLLGFLLNALSYRGAKALDLPDLAAKGVAATSTAVTEIFYVRAVMKFFDRAVNAYSTTKAAYIGSSMPALIAYNAFFVLSVLALTLSTSAGFVFEARKYTEDYGRVIQELYKFCWTIYAGLVANVGYFLLQMYNIAQAKLDAKETARPLYDSAGVAVLSEGESAKADAPRLKERFNDSFDSLTQPEAEEVRNNFYPGLFSRPSDGRSGHSGDSTHRRGSDRGSAVSLPTVDVDYLQGPLLTAGM